MRINIPTAASRFRFGDALSRAGRLASLLLSGTAAFAATATWDFTTDPTTQATNPIRIYQSGFADSSGTSVYWKDSGGMPGGFLGLTWSLGDSYTIALFPDIDEGKLVTAFRFECDVRIGNPNLNERAADGFSISFARSNDPVFDPINEPPTQGLFAGGIAEGGTTTGIAVSFDTWSGNALPDTTDIEGIIVRVDNKTVHKEAVGTRNGACDDTTSLQTGPRNLAYWTEANNAGTMPDAAFAPESWTNLCWQKLIVEVDTNAQLTVIYKGRVILDHFQTTYFPSAGGLVLAGRTGGADEHTHFDNIQLTTTAVAADTENPTAPSNLRALETGALRVLLTWDPATDNSGRVGYEIEQNGTVLPGTTVLGTNDLRGLSASTAYTFRIRATDVSGNKSDWSAPLNVTTVALVEDQVFGAARVYGTTEEPIAGTAVEGLLFDPRYPDSPDRVVAINGMQFGEPNFADTLGENLGVRIAGTVTPPVTGEYHFFVRSDDASQLFLNTTGPTIPVAGIDVPIAEETGCCEGFKEPDPELFQPYETTTTPIQLTAGQRYGILFLVKEGGGGDWGQVAWRRVGDPTPASALQAIGYPYFVPEAKPMVDPVGAVVNITQQPQNATTVANERVEFNVTAQTSSPYSSATLYQWFKNGTAIPGANTPNYVIPVAAEADNGAKFTVQVAVQGKAVTSSEATLTVQPDNKPPTITSVRWLDPFSVVVNFSEPVKTPAASNFTISDGVTVSAVQASGSSVQLTTSKQNADTAYTITVTGVQDNANNSVAANTTGTFRVPPFVPGKVKYEEWSGIGGTAVANLRADPGYPGNPDTTQFLDAFEAQVDHADNYGARLSAWFTPATSGSYVFFLSSDDNSELFLSTDENPANKKLIAMETAWSGTRDWVTSPGASDTTAKRSDQFATSEWPGGGAAISLQAGQRYYMEVLFKEGTGGDNAAVLAKLASAPDPEDDAAPLSGNVLGTYVPSTGGEGATIAISRSGAAIQITYTGTLESAEAITGPWSAVGGATSPHSVNTAGAARRFYRSRE